MATTPRIAIIYLSFHAEPYMERAVEAWSALNYPRESLAVVIVDNTHPTFGSSVSSWEAVLAKYGTRLPNTVVLPQTENAGFTRGTNVGIVWALAQEFDYIYLHNQDGFMAPNALQPLVAAFVQDPTVGVAQSLILLAYAPTLINSAGNALHFLGFGYCAKLRRPIDEAGKNPFEIDYASGAGMLLSAEVVKKYGALDDDFFLYHEDLEYSLRVRSVGKRIVCVPGSVFFHDYAFSRNLQKWYYMERNRWAVLLMYFRWRTLLLLVPALLVAEIGILLTAAIFGWLPHKLHAYG